jgi:histidine triad (HIT) family protein
MNKSIFERIADKEIPAYVVWEDSQYIAFLDINPMEAGHTIVVPKQNWGDNLFEIDDVRYADYWLVAKKVAKLLKEKLVVKRIFVSVKGMLVPHVHIHLIPHYADTEEGESNSEFDRKDFEGILERIKA